MGNIVGANGEELVKGGQIIDLEGSAMIQERKKKKVVEVKSDTPLLTSEEMDITPVGSRILARGFKAPETTKGGIILTEKDRPTVLPCLQVMKVGENVRVIKEGNWILLRQGLNPPAVPYGGETFFMFQETDVVFVYNEQPDIDHILGSETLITRDLTEYVKIDEMKKLRANITERMEGDIEG